MDDVTWLRLALRALVARRSTTGLARIVSIGWGTKEGAVLFRTDFPNDIELTLENAILGFVTIFPFHSVPIKVCAIA